jgi:site-specific recombinase XerD
VLTSKRAWQTAVLEAHGFTPEWQKGKHRLTVASLTAYRQIDLHFHDLRHEAGSRFLESGWPRHHVKEMLGHARIETTDTYPNVPRIGLQDLCATTAPTRTCNP